MKQSEIKFVITLDNSNNPEKIDWSASDAGKTSSSKSVMISVWDAKEKNTLRIDLWTKDMPVDEMYQFYHQNLVSMADSLERATKNTIAAKEMRKYAHEFGQQVKIFNTK
jgi:gliding motility-associated protein GldC